MFDSPHRWDILHNFDKTQKQTREFLRQALQEELDNDPECTFHPQLSEMSELIMRKHAKLSFLERVDIWARKREQTMKELKEHKKEEQELEFSFTPEINRKRPSFKDGKVYKKKGVKQWLERLERMKFNKDKEYKMRTKRRAKTPTLHNGMRVTVPQRMDITTSDYKKRGTGSPHKRQSSKEYLSKLRAIEHQDFIESLGNTTNKAPIKDMTYGDAVNQLHEQLQNMDLDVDRFKIRKKQRRRYN